MTNEEADINYKIMQFQNVENRLRLYRTTNRPELYNCPTHGPSTPFTMHVDPMEGEQRTERKSYTRCAYCYGEWVERSLPASIGSGNP